MVKKLIIIYIIALVLSGIVTKILVTLLSKNAKQPILKYVKEHYKKSGTPTMGGIGFISVTALLYFFCIGKKGIPLVTLLIFIIYGVIGFFDDFIKIKYKRNDGLTPVQKIVLQVLAAFIAVGFAVYQGLTVVYIPFTKKLVDLGYWFIPFGIFVFLATTNCVNLTDGLDGLAASTSSITLTVIAVIVILQTKTLSGYYLQKVEYEGLALLSITTAGALIGYLLYNANKASIFMGDTGSLSLGGLIASVFTFSGNALYIPLVGLCFVLSGTSVILQVAYYKKTKKRIFLMAPLHHHFQHKGYTEYKIVVWYSVITLTLGLISIACFL